MHHALWIQEILLNVFGHCDPPRTTAGYMRRETSDLAALARTCRAFKEPALDVLWGELDNPFPLAMCLPGAFHQQEIKPGIKRYTFSRSLTDVEWQILRSYTRRILSIRDHQPAFDWECVGILPATEPLFPNLRLLSCLSTTAKIKNLLYMPCPSLISLNIDFMDEDLHVLQHSLELFHKFSPNIKRLAVSLRQADVAFDNFFFNYICKFRKSLRAVEYSTILCDMKVLAHLSCMAALTRLSLTLSFVLLDQITSSDSTIFLSNLHDLEIYSDLLHPISRIPPRIRLPSITDLTATFEDSRSEDDLSFFLTNVRASGIGHGIQRLSLTQRYSLSSQPILGFADLRPSMAFRNLRHIHLDVYWKVDLKSSELLELASSWPHIEHLLINDWWGWDNTTGGITPDGLVQLLQMCRSLKNIALVMDTQGYTECASSSTGLGLILPPTFSIDVLDSVIDAESVLAVAGFFAAVAPYPNFSFRAWQSYLMKETVYKNRWNEVYSLANKALCQRFRHL